MKGYSRYDMFIGFNIISFSGYRYVPAVLIMARLSGIPRQTGTVSEQRDMSVPETTILCSYSFSSLVMASYQLPACEYQYPC